jgi:hypothetical protein
MRRGPDLSVASISSVSACACFAAVITNFLQSSVLQKVRNNLHHALELGLDELGKRSTIGEDCAQFGVQRPLLRRAGGQPLFLASSNFSRYQLASCRMR